MKPQAFLSYTHFDNKHDRGQITEIRKSLGEEIRVLTGSEFVIFQDVDIEVGQKWRDRIEKELSSATFLIPFITPNYFNSDSCLEELEYFIEHENAPNRRCLIMPIYYIDCSKLPRSDERQSRLFDEISSRQYVDWTDWQGKKVPSTAIRELARKVVEILPRANSGRTPLNPPRTSDLTIKEIVMTVTINNYGDGDYRYKYSGVSCKPNKTVSEAVLTRHVSWGQFGRFTISSKNTTNINVFAERNLVHSDETNEAVAKVRFGKPLTQSTRPITFELKMSLYGAFVADRLEQSQRKTKGVEGMGWISFTVDHPTEELRIVLQRDTIQFSEGTVAIAVFDGSGEQKKELELKNGLVVDIHLVRWRIKEPQVGFRYELQWKLPDPPPSRFSQGSISPEEIRKILIRAADSQGSSIFQDWVQQSMESYLRRFGDGQEDIDISLHVLDDEKYRLRLIAGPFPPDRLIWRWRGFKPGTGLVGRAYKCNRVAFFSTSRSGADADLYIHPKDPLFSDIQLEDYEVLLCCPVHWHTGRSRQDIIVLINVGSRSKTSKLHSYVPGRKFDDWLKTISKSALKSVFALITGGLGSGSGLTES